MQFRKLEWKDIISDGVIVKSDCKIKVYSYDIVIEFSIFRALLKNGQRMYKTLRDCRFRL